MKSTAIDPAHGATVDAGPPRLRNRGAAAAYLSCSKAQLDFLRMTGELTPVAMPGKKGRASRVPLYDVHDLDAAIDRWKSRGTR